MEDACSSVLEILATIELILLVSGNLYWTDTLPHNLPWHGYYHIPISIFIAQHLCHVATGLDCFGYTRLVSMLHPIVIDIDICITYCT